jgi:small neutral amino acid transporter SnatA (MarC family)
MDVRTIPHEEGELHSLHREVVGIVHCHPPCLPGSSRGAGQGSVLVLGISALTADATSIVIQRERLIRYVGAKAVSAVTRMMGLILVVIGVQMFIEGAHGAAATFR